MKKISLFLMLFSLSLVTVSCKTVWLNDIQNVDDNTYIIASYAENNGELYKCKKVGNKLKCKLIVAESALSM